MKEIYSKEELNKIIEEIINQKLGMSKNYIFTSSPKFIVLTKRLKKVVIFIITGVVILLGVLGGIFLFGRDDDKSVLDKFIKTPEKKEEKKTEIEIINPKSNTRNVAVMINNIKKVWGYQSGLQDAHIIYEIIIYLSI